MCERSGFAGCSCTCERAGCKLSRKLNGQPALIPGFGLAAHVCACVCVCVTAAPQGARTEPTACPTVVTSCMHTCSTAASAYAHACGSLHRLITACTIVRCSRHSKACIDASNALRAYRELLWRVLSRCHPPLLPAARLGWVATVKLTLHTAASPQHPRGHLACSLVDVVWLLQARHEAAAHQGRTSAARHARANAAATVCCRRHKLKHAVHLPALKG